MAGLPVKILDFRESLCNPREAVVRHGWEIALQGVAFVGRSEGAQCCPSGRSGRSG